MAKYPYIVNKDGVWYPAGTEVPADALAEKVKKTEEPNQDDFSQYMNAPIESNEVTYTKTEINRMAIAELKEVAKANGIDEADGMTGADLKKVLISKFGL